MAQNIIRCLFVPSKRMSSVHTLITLCWEVVLATALTSPVSCPLHCLICVWLAENLVCFCQANIMPDKYTRVCVAGQLLTLKGYFRQPLARLSRGVTERASATKTRASQPRTFAQVLDWATFCSDAINRLEALDDKNGKSSPQVRQMCMFWCLVPLYSYKVCFLSDL